MFGRGGNNYRPSGGGGNKVCNFYQQGRCKFGDNCKFEHPGANRPQDSGNRFAALSGQQSGNGFGGNRQRNPLGGGDRYRPGANQTLPYNLSKEIIEADLNLSERPQWPFSAYGPGKDAPRQLFGGFPLEQSFEEMRVLHYLAVAQGNPQQAIQSVEELYAKANQQVQQVLGDLDGAIKYIIDGKDEHPNRWDECKTESAGAGNQQSNPFSSAQPSTSAFGNPSGPGAAAPSQPAFGQAGGFGKPSSPFGAPSAPAGFGKPSPLGGQGSAFGQPSAPGQGSAFGQPSGMGASSGFGAPSEIGAKPSPFAQPSQPAFGQPSQPAQSSPFARPATAQPSSGFGAPSPLGAGQAGGAFGRPAFGQPSQPAAAPSPFGQQPQQASPSPFGQPSQPAASSPFAQASQQTTSAFGQPSAPQQAGGAFGKPAFGQPSQPAAPSPFGQPSQPAAASPFAQQPQAAASSPFGQSSQPAAASAFGQPSKLVPSPFSQASQPATSSPFAQASQAARPSPFGAPSGATPSQPLTNGTATSAQIPTPYSPDPSTYTTRSGAQLTSFKHQPVQYIGGIPHYRRPDNTWERIWFPDGPPNPNPDTQPDIAKLGEEGLRALEVAYTALRDSGVFPGGRMPEEPPMREWVRWDL